MANLRELFGDPGLTEEGGEQEFDLDAFMGEVDRLVADKPTEQDHGGSVGEAEPPPPDLAHGEREEESGEEAGAEPSSPAVPVEEAPASPPTPAAPPPPDPFSDLPPERRAALLALDETLRRDPAKAESVLRGLSAETPPVEPPRLPEDIEPGSFEARQWHDQQELRAQIAELSAATRVQQETFAKQQAATAAQQAGRTFAQRYVGKLEEQDVLQIARQAGESGIAGALASQTPDDLAGAYDKALEFVLWGNESYRQKVIGEAPVVQAGDQPEAKTRKRKLNALSSAASPVSGPVQKRSPLESRDDGRLTPQSKMGLVRELANGLARGAASDGTL